MCSNQSSEQRRYGFASHTGFVLEAVVLGLRKPYMQLVPALSSHSGTFCSVHRMCGGRRRECTPSNMK